MEFGIGTAQFGMDYGISNAGGQTPLEEVEAILNVASLSGIEVLDTAFGYGESEDSLGNVSTGVDGFKIIAKTVLINKNSILEEDVKKLEYSFKESLARLKVKSVYGLLIHNANDLLVEGGRKLFAAMKELKEEGFVQKIGLSAYYPEELDNACNLYDIDIVQFPLNILDQRMVTSGQLKKLKSDGIEVHTRSLFLQGLLLMEVERLNLFFEPLKPLLKRLRDYMNKNSVTPLEAAFAFIRLFEEVDCVVIGVNNQKQLKSNLEILKNGASLSSKLDFSSFAIEDPLYLDPSKWELI